MTDKKFTKLSELVDKDFTVEKVWGYSYKMWDNVARQMLKSDTWVEGHRKVYDVDTDKGKMDVSATQFGNMLEGVSKDGQANVVGRTFHVKSNGKTGMEIRYYINPVRNAAREAREDKIRETASEVMGEYENKVNLDDIPF